MYHPTAAEQGAAIFRSIAQGHMFENGNNRTAVAFWKEFITLNGVPCVLTDEQLMSLAYKVSEGKFSSTFHIAGALSGLK